MLYKRLNNLFHQPDFHHNPVTAIFKRISWRLRWLITQEPFIIPLDEALKIMIPKSGSGASIYYRGCSEPETADFMHRFLRPKMTVLDVGAHIGEYTLMAAKIVGIAGQVHAFEPQPRMYEILCKNIELNHLSNVQAHPLAISNSSGKVEFEICNEPSMSSIRRQLDSDREICIVEATPLDDSWSNPQVKVDLIKVDVEGAEKLVFEGASELMSRPPQEAPTWIFEYAPVAYAGFDYKPEELISLLQKYNYTLWRYHVNGQVTPFDARANLPEIVNVVATKDVEYLQTILNGKNASGNSMIFTANLKTS